MSQSRRTGTLIPDVVEPTPPARPGGDETAGDKPGDVVGSYELVRVLGEGSMGRVFLARHVTLGREAALKILRPAHAQNHELVQRFFQEARTVNQIKHEHIVEIFDFVEELEPGRVYCVMELLQGDTLSNLARTQALSIRRVVDIALQVCEALGAAHRLGVVHRDVKPDNVFVTPRPGRDDWVKVLDFGVAKLAAAPEQRTGEIAAPGAASGTMMGTIIGTPLYMAPEQASAVEVDHRADVYSLGAVLYELLAGGPPFGEQPLAELLLKLVAEPPPQLPGVTAAGERVPSALASVVMSCLEKGRDQRPSSMVALRDALAPFGSAASEARRHRRRRVVLGALATTAAFAVAVTSVTAWWFRTEPDRQVAREADAIRVRIADGRLSGAAGDSASARLNAARVRFPDRPEFGELAVSLAAALKKTGREALSARRYDEAAEALQLTVSLVPGDTEARTMLERAAAAAFATQAGMVQVDEAFWIDRYEYPNLKGAMPLTGVDWAEAEQLCGRAGKRLCTEPEWEQACRRSGNGPYPYGARFSDGVCVAGPREEGPAPAGSRAGCVTPSGIADLSGNVAEWTASPIRAGSPHRVVRGGFWSQPAAEVSCSARDYFLPGQGGAKTIGVRCCR